jgi:hypothetical protein
LRLAASTLAGIMKVVMEMKARRVMTTVVASALREEGRVSG